MKCEFSELGDYRKFIRDGIEYGVTKTRYIYLISVGGATYSVQRHTERIANYPPFDTMEEALDAFIEDYKAK